MAGSRTTRGGTKRTAVRRRAVGTRDRIITHLVSVAEVNDHTGMASTRLAEAVGYPGSSVAFAQLLSGMERDGLIAREVRGKRTYRIALVAGVAPARAPSPSPSPSPSPAAPSAARRGGAPDGERPGAGGVAGGAMTAQVTADSAALGAAGDGFDYDELARRLLIQLVRRLAATPTDLEQTVAGLERELVTAWTRHGTLTAENVRLREQLREAQRNLELLRQRSARLEITDELDKAEVVVLERLLAPDSDGEDQAPADREPTGVN